jgi:hypothetical protein
MPSKPRWTRPALRRRISSEIRWVATWRCSWRRGARGRARSVVALAPAGGWSPEDPRFGDALGYFILIRELLEEAAPRADEIVSTPQGMRRATEVSVAHFEHIPPELIGRH